MRSAILLLAAMTLGCGPAEGIAILDTAQDGSTVTTTSTTSVPDTSTSGTTGAVSTTSTTGSTPVGIQVEVGNGVTTHIPLADGDDVVLSYGAQGGWHIDVSGVVSNTPPVVGVTCTGTASDGTVIAGSTVGQVALGLIHDPVTMTGVFVGQQAPIDFLPSVSEAELCAYADSEIDLCVEVLDPINGYGSGTGCVSVWLRMDAAHDCVP